MCSTSSISIDFRMTEGISRMSFSFSTGMRTFLIPPRCAARTFSFRPPMGSTLPRSVTSPVVSNRDAGQCGDQRARHGDARRGAVLGDRALRDVNVNVDLLVEVTLEPELLGA